MNEKNVLVGKTLVGVKIASDSEALLFQTTAEDIIARCDGDCCSHTWIEHIESTIKSFPAVVISAEDVDMPDLGEMPDCDVVEYYGFRIVTDKGEMLIDYRNDSNGYYGGSLSWPSDYYYGGVYGQNNSTLEWKEIAK